MAAPVIAGLTRITDAESTTGWSNTPSGGPAPALNTDNVKQGSNSIGRKNGTGLKGMWYDNGSGIDFTVAGRHLYIWYKANASSGLNTLVNGGVRVRVGSSASNFNDYYIDGGDTYAEGEWRRACIDLNKTPTSQGGSGLTISSAQFFGITFDYTSAPSGGDNNVFIDAIDYGDSINIEQGDSTDPADWAALLAADEGTQNNQWGVVTSLEGVVYLLGGITIGDAAGSDVTLWGDASGTIVRFKNPTYYNGSAVVSSINPDGFYRINFQGNGTGTTDITFGDVVGSGDDRQGILGGSISTEGPPFTIDGETDIADLDTVNLYGVSIRGAGITQFSGSTKSDIIGCTFIECDEIQPNDAEFLNNTIIAPRPDRGLEMVSGHNIKKVTFVPGTTADIRCVRAWQVDESASPDTYVEQTDEFNSTATGDCNPFPATEAVNDFFAVGSRSKFSRLRVDTGTAGVAGVVAWEYWNGSSWSALSGVTDGSNGFTTTGLQNVDFTVPTDWEAVSLNGETPLFYIRARVTTVYTTNPVLDEGFIANTIEHHLHWPSTTGSPFTADALLFFGFAPAGAPKWQGENNSGGSITVNATNGSTLAENEVDDIGAASTTVNNTVTLRVTVTNQNGDLLQGINVRFEETDGTLIAQGSTNASGQFSFSHVYTGDLATVVIVRNKAFEDFETNTTITTNGFDIPARLTPDPDVYLP